MAAPKKSKKEVAVEYFLSLGDAIPLRERVDALTEYMKIQYVNGQTERVVFNYIRHLISTSEIIVPDDEILQIILSNKILRETNYDRKSGVYSSSDQNGKPTAWDLMSSKEKILKILPLMDFYTSEIYGANSCAFSRRDGKLYFGQYQANQEINDNGWISRFSDGTDSIKNHLPFLSKERLEQPLSNDTMVEISRNVLSETEAEEMRWLLKKHGSSQLALEALKELINNSSYVSSASAARNVDLLVPSKKPFFIFRGMQWVSSVFFGLGFVLLLGDISKLNSPGAPTILFFCTLAAVGAVAVAHSPPVFFRFRGSLKFGVYIGSLAAFVLFSVTAGQVKTAFDKTPQGIALAKSRAEAKAKSDAEANAAYEAAVRDEQRRYGEKRDYIEKEMQKAEDFCAKHPDYESCF